MVAPRPNQKKKKDLTLTRASVLAFVAVFVLSVGIGTFGTSASRSSQLAATLAPTECGTKNPQCPAEVPRQWTYGCQFPGTDPRDKTGRTKCAKGKVCTTAAAGKTISGTCQCPTTCKGNADEATNKNDPGKVKKEPKPIEDAARQEASAQPDNVNSEPKDLTPLQRLGYEEGALDESGKAKASTFDWEKSFENEPITPLKQDGVPLAFDPQTGKYTPETIEQLAREGFESLKGDPVSLQPLGERPALWDSAVKMAQQSFNSDSFVSTGESQPSWWRSVVDGIVDGVGSAADTVIGVAEDAVNGTLAWLQPSSLLEPSIEPPEPIDPSVVRDDPGIQIPPSKDTPDDFMKRDDSTEGLKSDQAPPPDPTAKKSVEAQKELPQVHASFYYPGGCTVGVDRGCSPGIEGGKMGSKNNPIDRDTPVIAAGYDSRFKFGDILKLTSKDGNSMYGIVGDVCPACGKGVDLASGLAKDLGLKDGRQWFGYEKVSTGNSWGPGLSETVALNQSLKGGPSSLSFNVNPIDWSRYLAVKEI